MLEKWPNLGPFLIAITICATALSLFYWLLHSDVGPYQPPPHYQAEPTNTPQTNQPSIVNQEDNQGGDDESHWYDTFVDHTTDWLLAVFTFCLVLYTRRLYVATDGLWQSTRNLWEAAKEQARDMKESLRISREAAAAAKMNADIMFRTQRAHLHVKGYNTTAVHNQNNEVLLLEISASWKNFGLSPADSINLYVDTTTIPTNAPEEDIVFQVIDTDEKGTQSLGQGDSVSTLPIRLPIELARRAWAGERKLLLYAGASYDDIFESGLRHTIERVVEILFTADPGVYMANPETRARATRFVGVDRYRIIKMRTEQRDTKDNS